MAPLIGLPFGEGISLPKPLTTYSTSSNQILYVNLEAYGLQVLSQSAFAESYLHSSWNTENISLKYDCWVF